MKISFTFQDKDYSEELLYVHKNKSGSIINTRKLSSKVVEEKLNSGEYYVLSSQFASLIAFKPVFSNIKVSE